MTKVFIGSTSLDLKAYRDAAIETCNALSLIPVGMEYFEAMGVGATEGSKLKLDQADVYVGIFAFRYGYIEKGYGGKSVTEIEFNYAGERGIERLCFLMDQEYPYPHKYTDLEHGPKLIAFRKRVNALIRAEFREVSDFKYELLRALTGWQDRNQKITPVPRPSESSAVFVEVGSEIPSYTAKFKGRKKQIKQIHQNFKTPRRLLLHGPGEIGKTTLAAQCAASYLPIIWLEVGQDNTDTIFQSLAHLRKKGKEVFDKDRQTAIATNRGATRKQIMENSLAETGAKLLVLDDVCDSVALHEVLEAIPDEMKVIVTSRTHHYFMDSIHIPQLSPREALEVLSTYSRPAVGKEPAAADLCKFLGYFPLELELAGTLLKGPYHSAKELLDAMMQLSPDEIPMPPGFAREGRENLKKLLDTRMSSLDEKLRRVFFAMGAMFVTGATPKMLSLYLDEDQGRVEKALKELAGYSLVEHLSLTNENIGYYRIYGLAYNYARYFGNVNVGRALETCHHYLLYYKDRPDKMPWLEVERDNILGAASKAKEDNPELFVDLTYWLVEDGKNTAFFDERIHTDNSYELLETAANLSQKQFPEKAYSLFSKLAYTQEHFKHEFTAALQNHEKALEIARQIHRPLLEAKTLSRMASICSKLPPQDKASQQTDNLFEQAEKIARAHQDGKVLSLVLQNRADREANRPNAAQEDYEQGSKYAQEAANLAQPLKDYEEIYFQSLNTLGYCELKLAQTPEQLSQAQQHLEAALQVAETQKNRRWMAYAYENLGQVYHQQGNPSQARMSFEKAIECWQIVGLIEQGVDYVKEELMKTLGYDTEAPVSVG